MKPIESFDFSKLDDDLAKEYITIHNQIYRALEELRMLVKESNSQKYLDVFLNQFSIVSVDPKHVGSTIICMPRIDIENLDRRLELITKSPFKQELLNVSSVCNLEYFKIIDREKLRLEAKTKRSNDEKKKLENYKAQLTGTIKLFPLLLNILDYEGRRKQLLLFYAQSQQQVCAYCLAQSTSIYRSKGQGKKFYLTGNLDHVKPKSHYPLYTVSLNNLIPVCGHCNQRKSNTKYKYDPFNPKHEHKFVFSNCLEYDKSSSKVKLESLGNMEISTKNSDFSKLSEKLDFQVLYQNFSGNAKIMVERFHKFHSDGYKANIESLTKKDIDAEMEYFVSEIPLINDNIHKFPLTKFKMDLYNEIKTKYDQNKPKKSS